jgi:molybdopterin converting factor small subunit
LADEDIRFGEVLATAVEDGAEVTILPAVAGGS